MRRRPWLPAKSDGLILGGLILAALVLGGVANLLRSEPLPLRYVEHAPVPEATDLDLAQFKALAASGQVLILDARPGLFYQLGHVPGALSLPHEEFDAAYQRLRLRLEARRSELIAIYCTDESCEDARGVQTALRGLGFGRATVFTGGWEAWTAAGLPKAMGTP